MKTKREDLVSNYIRDLSRELQGFSSHQRQEIIAEVREHIEASLIDSENTSEAALLNTLERLGAPSDIAEEAYERFGVSRHGSTRREILVLILLTLGGIRLATGGTVFPTVVWTVAVILLWSSSVWGLREKLIGSGIVPLGLVAVLLVPLLADHLAPCYVIRGSAGQVLDPCAKNVWGPHPVFPAISILLLVVQLASVGYLIFRLHRDSRA